MCPSDPLVYNELGVIHYLNKEYTIAIEYFRKVLEICESSDPAVSKGTSLSTSVTLPPSCDPTIVNLAHCFRKLGYVVFTFEVIHFISPYLIFSDYKQAVHYYEISLSLNPFDDNTASTYTALGYTQHLMVILLFVFIFPSVC